MTDSLPAFELRARRTNDEVDLAPGARAFHRKLPGYLPTPLVDASGAAAALGLGRLWVKDESSRLGLPSFKILGASWGAYRALHDRVGGFGEWGRLDELVDRLAPHGPLTLGAATDGNHGRAVARMARLLGLRARIFVPEGTVAARIQGIESEGATCVVVRGSYDDAVARAAEEAGDRCLVISDTSWPGYSDVPRWVIEGYGTIFEEIDEQLAAAGARPPDVVVIQVGVGALAAAAAHHFGRGPRDHGLAMVAVEPASAACVLASVRAGRVVTVAGPHDSIMAGLNCGTPSAVAWPLISAGYDLYLAIEDERAREGMRILADEGIVAGETGAAGVGALVEVLEGERSKDVRAALGITASTSALVLCTEGATDPAAYAAIVATRATSS